MTTLVAFRIGEVGYVGYLHELRRLHVLTTEDLLVHLRLHGAVLRITGQPVDHEVAGLARELGGPGT